MELGGSYCHVESAIDQSLDPTRDPQSQRFAAYGVEVREVDKLVVIQVPSPDAGIEKLST